MALFPQFFLHLDLGCDARMITARKPQRGIPLHPLKADQDVLQRAVHGVPHMQLSRHIGRRHDNCKRFFLRIPLCVEIPALFPHFVDAGFHLFRIVSLWQFFHGFISLNIRKRPERNTFRAKFPRYHLNSANSLPHSALCNGSSRSSLLSVQKDSSEATFTHPHHRLAPSACSLKNPMRYSSSSSLKYT